MTDLILKAGFAFYAVISLFLGAVLTYIATDRFFSDDTTYIKIWVIPILLSGLLLLFTPVCVYLLTRNGR